MTPSAVPVVEARRVDCERPGAPGASTTHVGRVVGAGLPAAVATYFLLATGTVSNFGALGVLTLLAMAVPTSPDLGRRLALNLSLVIGWAPVLWWVRWPVRVDHGAFLAAMTVGGLVGWVLFADRPDRRVIRLVPRCRLVDALILLGAGLALGCMRRWAFPPTAHEALVVLLPGADNYAHFHMFSTLRTYGAVTSALGSVGDRSGWGFDDYPQGFHALAASLSELLRPRWTPGVDSLVAYTQVVALVVVLGVVVLTSAVVSLPGLRTRPLLALPVVVTTWAAFLWSPGQQLLVDGFANFWVAGVAVGCALLLGLAPGRRLGTPDVAAVAGLLVAVAHSWAPLVVIAAPAVPALFYPFAGLGARSLRRPLLVALGVVALGGLGVAKALLALLADIDVGQLVTAFGGIHGSSPLPTFVLVVLAGYLCCCAPLLLRHHAQPELLLVARRARLLGLAPLAGLLLAALLLIAQLRTVGTSSYYFVKFVMGYELALAAFVPALAGMLAAWLLPEVRTRRLAVLPAIVMTLVLSQSFGPFIGRDHPLLDPAQSGTASIVAPYSGERIADGVLAAVVGNGSASSFDRDYLAIGPERAAEAFYPDGWYHAALASLSRTVSVRLNVLRTKVNTVAEAVPVARRYLEDNPNASLVVDPAYVEALRDGLGDIRLDRRVSDWSVQAERER